MLGDQCHIFETGDHPHHERLGWEYLNEDVSHPHSVGDPLTENSKPMPAADA